MKQKNADTNKDTNPDKAYYDNWPGVEHIPYKGDYHVDNEDHLKLDQVAKKVAKQQVTK